MSAERCACGRFLTLPGGMAQIEDGVYHVPAGAPACEVIALRDEVERLTREVAEWRTGVEAANRIAQREQARANAAEELLRFGKVVSPSMLDSVSDRDARILSAWAAVRQREADQAKAARNAAEAREAEARAALAAEQERHRGTALMSSAYVGALLDRVGAATITNERLRAARLYRVEAVPGGCRFIATDTTLGEELARAALDPSSGGEP